MMGGPSSLITNLSTFNLYNQTIHKRKAELQARKAADAVAEARKLRAKNARARKAERTRQRTASEAAAQ